MMVAAPTAPSAGYTLGETLIELDKIGLSYGDKPVLAGISACVQDIVRPGCITGQIVGILGPSGIGKTQLSRIMTGLQLPTSGRVLVGSPNLRQRSVEAGLVGYVAQNYPLLNHRTVRGNLAVAARRAGADDKTANDRAMDYLRRFGLEDKWDVYPAQLSGGQRQRVAIAQQLLCSEHFLILDEPTTGLDPIMKDKVCDLIRQVSSIAEENTIFVITHDIHAVLQLADHLWLLGRKRDEKGNSLGAVIRSQYNLMERGIAWQPSPTQLPAFVEVAKEIRAEFETL